MNINIGLTHDFYDAFNLDDSRVGAPVDVVPTFIAMHLDRSLLKPVDHMKGGTGTVQYRRALDPSVLALGHGKVLSSPIAAMGAAIATARRKA